ncbi:uncharacterized protein LOC123865096 [Maniola jurtina]|uniref:uncharacterized protein LOC123865096 n=1 Tax=Maniola jurtina TaxID=191418 RepID=UPI001E68F31E|nr:uncharacterized protein LOC123865096 [Maniola jurtina]
MEGQMVLLLEKLKDQMDQQTVTITNAVTKNILELIDEKIKPLRQENENLKMEIHQLRDKVKSMEIEKKRNNLVIFGLEESPETKPIDSVRVVFKENLEITLEKHEIIKAHRLGLWKGKARPILVSLTTNWRKNEIMKNKKKLPKGISINEDFSKETLAKRKELIPKLQEERKKGRIAYIKEDKLIVKEAKDQSRDKRKRESSSSPSPSASATESEIVKAAPKKKLNKINAFEKMYRPRSQSLSEQNKL